MASLKVFRICLIATIAAVAAATVGAQGTDLPRRTQFPRAGSIVGRVLTASGASIKGRVMVRLSNFSSAGLMNYTDSNGEFSFTNLVPGTFNLEVVADTNIYESTTESVNLPPSGRVVLTIHLSEKTHSDRKAPASAVVSAGDLDQNVPDSARKEFEAAAKLLEKKDTKQAIQHLKQAIAIWPDYLVARNTLGVEYLKLKQLSGAAEQFDAAIRINAKSFNSQLYMGIVLVQQKRYAEALGHLSQAVSIDSTQANAHLYLGIALLGASDLAVALKALSKAISIGGLQYSIAHYYMAHVHMKSGARDQAVRELEVYLQESPTGEQAGHARTLLEKLKSGG